MSDNCPTCKKPYEIAAGIGAEEAQVPKTPLWKHNHTMDLLDMEEEKLCRYCDNEKVAQLEGVPLASTKIIVEDLQDENEQEVTSTWGTQQGITQSENPAPNQTEDRGFKQVAKEAEATFAKLLNRILNSVDSLKTSGNAKQYVELGVKYLGFRLFIQAIPHVGIKTAMRGLGDEIEAMQQIGKSFDHVENLMDEFAAFLESKYGKDSKFLN